MKKISLIKSILMLLLLACSQVYGQSEWVNLFDGKTLKGWKLAGGKALFKVEKGAIVGKPVLSSQSSFLMSEKEFGDFVLEMEVKMVDTTVNSGIQFRSRYDALGFGGQGKVYGYQYELDPTHRNWTGGIYDQNRRGWLYQPSLSISQNGFKLNQYNKVKIECVGNTMITWINNKPAAALVDSVDKKGFVALQIHSINNAIQLGAKIYWKNIRIKPVAKLSHNLPANIYVLNKVPNTLSSIEKTNGWKLLFDGKSNSGWKGAYKTGFPEKGWFIKDGVIGVEKSNGAESSNGGDIVTTEKFSAFDLSFEFNLAKGGNSGVKYFVTLTEKNKGSAIGLEYQILDDSLHTDAKKGKDGSRTLASLYDLIKAKKISWLINQPGKWNTGRIIVYPNNYVEHYLNGVKVLEYNRGSDAFRKIVAGSKHKSLPNFGEASEGHILLQDHGDEVVFRSIKIRHLNNSTPL